jgi:cold-inducible RNA-binding protein
VTKRILTPASERGRLRRLTVRAPKGNRFPDDAIHENIVCIRSGIAYDCAGCLDNQPLSRHGRSSGEFVFSDDFEIRSSGTVWEGAVGLNDEIIMSTKLYVGNLPFDVTENDLREMLSQHGPVNEINVIMDKMTGQARGFAFVTMNTQEGATAAIQALNGKDWKGRSLTVNEARPREERSGGGGRNYSNR